MLPAHSSRSPQANSRVQARPGTPLHLPNPSQGLRLETALLLLRNPFLPPRWGRPRPAGGLGATCTAMAVMLHRGSATLPPRSLPLLRCVRRRRSWDFSRGGGAGRLPGGRDQGKGGSIQSGGINPGAGSACLATVRSSVYAESAGRPGGAPGERGGGRARGKGRARGEGARTRLLGVRYSGSEGGGSGTRGRADPADNPPGLTPSLPNLRDDFAWGAGSSRARRRRRKGWRIRFQPQLVESSVGRVQREEARASALLSSPPAL